MKLGSLQLRQIIDNNLELIKFFKNISFIYLLKNKVEKNRSPLNNIET